MSPPVTPPSSSSSGRTSPTNRKVRSSSSSVRIGTSSHGSPLTCKVFRENSPSTAYMLTLMQARHGPDPARFQTGRARHVACHESCLGLNLRHACRPGHDTFKIFYFFYLLFRFSYIFSKIFRIFQNSWAKSTQFPRAWHA